MKKKVTKKVDGGDAVFAWILIIVAIVVGIWILNNASRNDIKLQKIDDCVRQKADAEMRQYNQDAWNEYAEGCKVDIR